MARAQTVTPQQYAPALPKDNVKRLPPAPTRPVRRVEVPRTSAWAATLGDRALPWLLPLALLGLWYLGLSRAGCQSRSCRRLPMSTTPCRISLLLATCG